MRYMMILLVPFLLQAAVFDIAEFGAVADSTTLNTAAIQRAIDSCHDKGGGMVRVPTGTFITGTLVLKSHVHLHLESGAVLKGSSSLKHYMTIGSRRYGLLYAKKVRDIAITGEGTLDGSGTPFHGQDSVHVGQDFDRDATRQGQSYMRFKGDVEDGPITKHERPGMMVVILQSENVQIRNLTFQDSPSWTFRIGDCDGVRISGISILNNLLVPNSDGIHLTTSRNVRISDCDIRAGDDALIVTGFGAEIDVDGDDSGSDPDYAQRKVGNKSGYAENITVSNCVLKSRSSGIRVGYGMNPIRNCVFQNIVIHQSNRGIGVFSRDAGSIHNILFSDMTISTRLHTGHWWGNGEPIHVSAIAQNGDISAGEVSDIRFKNIIAESEAGILIWGERPDIIRDLVLDDIDLTIRTGGHTDNYGGNFDLRPVADLSRGIFSHNVPGLFAQNVKGMDIRHFSLDWQTNAHPFFTHGIECRHVHGLYIEEFRGEAATAAETAKAVQLTNCTMKHSTLKK